MTHRTPRTSTLAPLARVGLVLAALIGYLAPAHAATVAFDTAPFSGASANPDDNIRTIFGGNERQLPAFDLALDVFSFDRTAFGLVGELSFVSALAGDLPASGARVIVLQSTDNDNNPATGFNAGSAANLIANAVTQDGAGFFIYSNSGLKVNRLVYSTNLNVNTADLAILARIVSPNGAGALAALPGFSASNFAATPVPEPTPSALLAAGLAVLVWRRCRPSSPRA